MEEHSYATNAALHGLARRFVFYYLLLSSVLRIPFANNLLYLIL